MADLSNILAIACGALSGALVGWAFVVPFAVVAKRGLVWAYLLLATVVAMLLSGVAVLVPLWVASCLPLPHDDRPAWVLSFLAGAYLSRLAVNRWKKRFSTQRR